jgi:hypothetical protein
MDTKVSQSTNFKYASGWESKEVKEEALRNT